MQHESELWVFPRFRAAISPGFASRLKCRYSGPAGDVSVDFMAENNNMAISAAAWAAFLIYRRRGKSTAVLRPPQTRDPKAVPETI
jgi:hypothetical protein